MQRFWKSRYSMLVTADLVLLSPRKMELCTGRRHLLMERELGSTATLIMMGRPSLSDTLLELMDSGSWKELTFPPELLVLKLHLSLLPSRLLLLSAKLLLSARLLL